MKHLLLPEIKTHTSIQVKEATTSIVATANENKTQSDMAESAIAKKKSLWQFSS